MQFEVFVNQYSNGTIQNPQGARCDWCGTQATLARPILYDVIADPWICLSCLEAAIKALKQTVLEEKG